MSEDHVQHVAETALLAAGWRAMESGRSDGLFDDPLAAGLAGERGLRIAKSLPLGAWVVAIRTVVIDAFLRAAISSGTDTIINLGAGLDTRPYRMDLLSSIRWFEVDHPSVIERKVAHLRDAVPACSVERFGFDLAELGPRRELFDRIGATALRAMALTEGVIGYMTVEGVGALADDLHALPTCERWVTEYLSPRLLRAYRKHQPLRAIPVRFDPGDWDVFFTDHGWRVAEMRFLGEESQRLHRPVPLPPLDRMMRAFTSRPLRDMGYAVLERVS